jgi:ParB family chromosome partitioning protein
LLNLCEQAKEALDNERITTGHARALLSLESHEDQSLACQKIIDDGLNVRQTEKFIKNFNASHIPEIDSKHVFDPELSHIIKTALEKIFVDAPGIGIDLKGTQDRGSIKITYRNCNEFDKIRTALERDVLSPSNFFE